jgi:formiminoglutamase
MELACRGYMTEPAEPFTSNNWPSAYDPAKAAGMRTTLTAVMRACLAFATN